MFMVQILASVATMEAETTKVRFQSGYRNYLANGGKVGRKKDRWSQTKTYYLITRM